MHEVTVGTVALAVVRDCRDFGCAQALAVSARDDPLSGVR
jgi:hypothetical protein